MQFRMHDTRPSLTAELISDDILITDTDSALDLIAEAGNVGAENIILRDSHLVPGFFDLSTTIAGEILQKFSTYRLKLAIVGDFSIYPSKSLKNFISESNRRGPVYFVASSEAAVRLFSGYS